MKTLSVALFLALSLNVAMAQSSSTTDFTTYTSGISFTLMTGTDGKIQYQQVVEDAGVFLATQEMTPELAEVVKALREEYPDLSEVSDKELVKIILRDLKK